MRFCMINYLALLLAAACPALLTGCGGSKNNSPLPPVAGTTIQRIAANGGACCLV